MQLDQLESRRLLSVTLQGSDLRIIGSSGNDIISVTSTGTNLVATKNGGTVTFPLASVKSIHAESRGGNDQITIAQRVTIPAWLSGGAANDTLTGGGGRDTLLGGDRNDFLVGGPRGDVISGGAGKDICSYHLRTSGVVVTLNGLPDDGAPGEHDNVEMDVETIVGSRGNDSLVGDGHGNRLYGSSGDDTLSGGRGNDLLDGGVGNDVLLGDPGDDMQIGGGGNDRFVSASTFDGHDSLIGGDGTDTADYHSRTIGMTIGGSDSEDTLDSSIEQIIGTSGSDTIERWD